MWTFFRKDTECVTPKLPRRMLAPKPPRGLFPPKAEDGDTLIWGASHIAAEANISVRRAFHLLETGAIPAQRCGKFWVTSRKKILALAEA